MAGTTRGSIQRRRGPGESNAWWRKGDEEAGEGAKRSLVEGPTLAVCLCIGLVLGPVVLVPRPQPRGPQRHHPVRRRGPKDRSHDHHHRPSTTDHHHRTTGDHHHDRPRHRHRARSSSPTQTPTTTPAPVPTTAPPASTTTAPTYVPPHIATQTIPGAFGSGPGVVSGSYSVTTAGGVVSATGTWSGGNALSLSVTCASGGSSSQQGATGLTVSATCNQGSATVSFGEIPPDQTNVSYNLDISYPSN